MDKSSPPAAISILAGGLAGASETLVTYPAEFVKTRRQLENVTLGKKSTSSLTILRSTLQSVGLSGIYAGCQTLAVSNALKSGVRFFSFETAKRQLTPYFEKGASQHTGTTAKNPWLNLVAGLCAGATESLLIVTPGESLKTRVIHDAASGGQLGKLPLARIVTQTVRQHGILSLWRGFTPVLCKQGTNSAVRFTTFGALKDKLQEIWPSSVNGTTATMIAGAGSGVVTVYASMPFDNVKTRMQGIGSSNGRMLSVAGQMLANEGVSVFWKATTPRLVRLTLSSSVTFMVYDKVIKIYNAAMTERHAATAKMG
ncbi:mitochondrial carrier [Aaosphaeria arxii CBS 175.79]|uniref:Mitochondrial carrier n=1 Tax=Aaosphaeria arxii CBS 175.79 TaxID=1450172 RepID=A0A6A5Y6D6_9PLEO|nr:mitochondrial carrier [Aaosphaeria arxii CBS 175.79]KAF2020856.1 mitochondrial carrier [Aaosphaeria arxii CBS 175.79]